MYNNVYQEYINNMIGGRPSNQSDFENLAMANANTYNNFQSNMNMDLERFYPELYKLLYPMIQTACMRNTRPITEETINEMVSDIYSHFNAENATTLNINLTNNVRKSNEQQLDSNSRSTSKQIAKEIKTTEAEETRVSRSNDFVLNDLIRILLIRELLGKPENMPPIRPGFSPQRPRDGMPPFMQREMLYI